MFANEELGSGSVVDGLKTAYFNKVGFFPKTTYCQCCTEIKYMAYDHMGQQSSLSKQSYVIKGL